MNPDPTAHFIIAANHQQYHYEHDSSIQNGSGCHWIFPYRQSFVMDHAKPFCIIGIKFKVGALYALGQDQLQFALDKASVSVSMFRSRDDVSEYSQSLCGACQNMSAKLGYIG